MHPILSHYQAQALLQARAAGTAVAAISLDLNLSTSPVTLSPQGVTLPDGRSLTFAQLTTIAANENACYLVTPENEIEKIHFFSETHNRFYSLMPTTGAPTMLVSGFPMHRIKDTDPHQDTISKIKSVSPITGHVLDTTMGLGYTAIMAAQTAVSVTTIELDPTVLDICRHNPWSQDLFTNPKITRLIGDAYDVVAQFPDAHFARILHDPPMFSLAGDLYAAEFYRQLYRILTPKGRLFHYIGDPQSKSGRSVTRGVVRRLQEAGFHRVKPYPQAFGVVAYK
ncbi:MAG: methyltransferase domain-containing protein [Anaerolinea sp.]|nr:methyltransferase domain-containing protein [Anaerolinea sp.]